MQLNKNTQVSICDMKMWQRANHLPTLYTSQSIDLLAQWHANVECPQAPRQKLLPQNIAHTGCHPAHFYQICQIKYIFEYWIFIYMVTCVTYEIYIYKSADATKMGCIEFSLSKNSKIPHSIYYTRREEYNWRNFSLTLFAPLLITGNISDN